MFWSGEAEKRQGQNMQNNMFEKDSAGALLKVQCVEFCILRLPDSEFCIYSLEMVVQNCS